MIRSLWTAASGMNSQQFNIDTISHNLSNVNTTGYKKVRADFEDLLYQNLRLAGTPIDDFQVVPTGIQVGLGVKPAATQTIFQQGSLQNTENKLDISLVGNGFLRFTDTDGSVVYSRDGSLKIDSNKQLVNSNGLRLIPEITLPDGFLFESIFIDDQGKIAVTLFGSDQSIEVGQIITSRFINPAGLLSLGSNLFQETAASGAEISGIPSMEGQPKIKQGFLEMSNVKVIDAMVSMITAQRAYEFNSKAIITSDSMLQTAVSLRR